MDFTRGLTVSLDDFDEHARWSQINSPRSLEACAAQGIEPEELLVRTVAYFKEHSTPVEAEIPHYAEKRFLHYEENRQAKLKLCRQERQNIITGGSRGSDAVEHQDSSSSDAIKLAQQKADARLQAEHVNMEKMQQRQMKKLNNMLAFEVLKQQTVNKFQASIDRQATREREEQIARANEAKEKELQMKLVVEEKRRKDEQEAHNSRLQAQKAYAEAQRKMDQIAEEREKKKKEAAERANEREILTIERRRHLEAIQKAQMDSIQARAAVMAEKEEERLAIMEQVRQEKIRETAEKAAQKALLLQRASERNDQLMRQKREEFLVKEQHAEERRQAFEQHREEEKVQRARMAVQKEMELERAKQFAQAKLEEKRNQYYTKEERAEQRRQERERERQKEQYQLKLKIEAKERGRLDAIQSAQNMIDMRVNDLLEKRATLEEKQQAAISARQKEQQEAKLQEQLLQMDRQEHVVRMRRIKQYQKSKLLQKIALDAERVETMQRSYAILAQKRAEMRALGDLQQTALMDNFNKLKKSGRMADIDTDNCDVVKLGLLNANFNFSKTAPMRPPRPPYSARHSTKDSRGDPGTPRGRRDRNGSTGSLTPKGRPRNENDRVAHNYS